MITKQKNYWNLRYTREKCIWGEEPSGFSKICEKDFQDKDFRDILVVGCGYGRHAEYFNSKGYHVMGIDVSEEAIELARQRQKHVTSHCVLDYEICAIEKFSPNKKFDVIYGFNIIHLFYDSKLRHNVYSKMKEWLNPQGYCYFCAMSTKDRSYGKGKCWGEDIYESKPGRIIKYFGEISLASDLSRYFKVEKLFLHIEIENHGGSEHEHDLVAAICRTGRNE